MTSLKDIRLFTTQSHACSYLPDQQAQTLFTNTPDPARKLRVGYCSPDLRDHSVSFFLEPILASHNAETIELVAYAEVRKPDAATERIKQKFSQWRSTVGLSDAQVVEMVGDSSSRSSEGERRADDARKSQLPAGLSGLGDV